MKLKKRKKKLKLNINEFNFEFEGTDDGVESVYLKEANKNGKDN